jgi:pSer/pThr/pTyr-binding forkhead associated (FHA) protein
MGEKSQEQPSGDNFKLILENTPQMNTEIKINHSPYTIGRSGENQLILDDITVGKNHCRIIKIDNIHYIQDNGSMNGTYLNKKILPKHSAEGTLQGVALENNDLLQIGKFKFKYIEY